MIKRLNEEFGMTVIVSSHILSELQSTATRFGIVNNGMVAREITTEELQSMERAVRIAVDDLDRAKEALEGAGVKVLDVQHESNSLEAFYFNLVGGN
jgi:ABC-2 type transport system ATP-binding protein